MRPPRALSRPQPTPLPPLRTPPTQFYSPPQSLGPSTHPGDSKKSAGLEQEYTQGTSESAAWGASCVISDGFLEEEPVWSLKVKQSRRPGWAARIISAAASERARPALGHFPHPGPGGGVDLLVLPKAPLPPTAPFSP